MKGNQVSAAQLQQEQHEEQNMSRALPFGEIDSSLMEAKLYVSADGSWIEIGTGEVQLHPHYRSSDVPCSADNASQDPFYPGTTAPDSFSFSQAANPSHQSSVANENERKEHGGIESLELFVVSRPDAFSSQDLKEDFLLRTAIVQSCVYRVHEDTTLLWVDPALGKDIALSFSSKEGCNFAMEAIRYFQERTSTAGSRNNGVGQENEINGSHYGKNVSTTGRSSSIVHGNTLTDSFCGGVERWEVCVENFPYILESARNDPLRFGPFLRNRSDYWENLTVLFREYHKRAILRHNKNNSKSNPSKTDGNSNSNSAMVTTSTTTTTITDEDNAQKDDECDINKQIEEDTVLDQLAQIGFALLRSPYTTDSVILAQFVDSMDDCIDIVQYGLGRKNKQLGFVSAEERRASFRNPCDLDVEMREQIHVLHSCHYLRDLLPLSLEEIDAETGNVSPLIEILETFQNTLVEKICTSDKWLRNAFRRYTEYNPLCTATASTSCLPTISSSSSDEYLSSSPDCDLANFVLDLSKTIKSSKMWADQKVSRYQQLFEAGMLSFFTTLLYRYVHRYQKPFRLDGRQATDTGSNSACGPMEEEEAKKRDNTQPHSSPENEKGEGSPSSPECERMPPVGTGAPSSAAEKELSRAVQSACETLTHAVVFYVPSLQLLLTEALEAPTGKCTLALIIQCVLCAGENAVQHSAFELVSSFFYQACVETQRNQIIFFWLSGSPVLSSFLSLSPPSSSSPPYVPPLQQMVECLATVFRDFVAQLRWNEEKEEEEARADSAHTKNACSSSPVAFLSFLHQEVEANLTCTQNGFPRENYGLESSHNKHNSRSKNICLDSHIQLIALYSLKIIRVVIEFSDLNAFGHLCRLFHKTQLFHALGEFLTVDSHFYMNLQSSVVGVVACLIQHSDRSAEAVAKLCTESRIVHVATSVFLSHCRRPSMYTCSLGSLISLIGTAAKDSAVFDQNRGSKWSPFVSTLPSYGEYGGALDMDLFGSSSSYRLHAANEVGRAHYSGMRLGIESDRLERGSNWMSGHHGVEGQERLDSWKEEEERNDATKNGCGLGHDAPLRLRETSATAEEEDRAVGEDNPFRCILVSLLENYEEKLQRYAHTLYERLRSVVDTAPTPSKQREGSSSSFSTFTDFENSAEYSSGTFLQTSGSSLQPTAAATGEHIRGAGAESEEEDMDKYFDELNSESSSEPNPSPPEDSATTIELKSDANLPRRIGAKSASERLESDEEENERKRGKKNP